MTFMTGSMHVAQPHVDLAAAMRGLGTFALLLQAEVRVNPSDVRSSCASPWQARSAVQTLLQPSHVSLKLLQELRTALHISSRCSSARQVPQRSLCQASGVLGGGTSDLS